MKRTKWNVLVWSFMAVFGTAALGSFYTDIGPWYESIKPSITPPNFVFPIVWMILFFLIFLALYFSWTGATKKEKIGVFNSYGLNLCFNFLWTLFYFYMHNPLLALMDIVFLWLSIVWMIYVSYRIDKNSAYMLIPYLLWVSFAALLNVLSIH